MSELNRPKHANHWKHGANYRNKQLYSVWRTMLHRCEDEKREKYKDYGEMGITVCQEWHDPNLFIDWAESHGYKNGLQLDRIDNDGCYSPENCRWVTPKQNSRNRRNTKYLTINGETKCVAEWCETISISEFTIYWWIREKGREYAEKRVSEAIAAWNRRVGESE